jgi:predicted transcriptional regulator
MKTPCELVVGKIMPAMRASVVKELSRRYHMKQADIARRLGITQASVSQYLSSARGASTRMTEKFPEIKANAKEIAKRINAGEGRYEWSPILCRACKEIRENEAFCKMHRIESRLAGCDICKKA